MSDGLALVLVTLAAYRVWRLMAIDDVTEAWRRVVFGGQAGFELPQRFGWVYSLVTCAWCAGSWVAFAAVAGLWAVRPLPLPALWFGAVAAGVGLVHAVVERLEPGDW